MQKSLPGTEDDRMYNELLKQRQRNFSDCDCVNINKRCMFSLLKQTFYNKEIWKFMCLQRCSYGVILKRHNRTRKSRNLLTQAVLKYSKLFGVVTNLKS